MKLLDVQKLRAVAIFMVLFGHLPFTMPNVLIHGYTGVSLFFVISGFVVSMTFLKRFPAPGPGQRRRVWQHVRDFYLRRLFRILPVAAIWIGIYFCIAQMIRLGGGSYGDVPRWIREASWFFSGFYNYFFAHSHQPGLFGQYWSLAVEMQFYALLPALLLVLRTQRQRVWLCIVSILAVWTVLRAVTPSDQIGLLTHTQADALFAGVLLYLLMLGIGAGSREAMRDAARRVPQWARNTIFAGIVAALMWMPSVMDGPVSPMIKYPIFTVVSALAVFLAQMDVDWVFGGSRLVDSFMEWVGDRSYSLYVCHLIFFSGLYPFVLAQYPALFPAWVLSTSAGTVARTLVMFGLVLAMSDLSYRFIELPFIKLGKRVVLSMAGEQTLAPGAQVMPEAVS